MKIKIAHLYYDLMNLYGEQGNITALLNAFKNQKCQVEIHQLSTENEIDFNQYDIFYMGAGSIDNYLITLNDIKKYEDEIRKVIEDGRYFIATGNSHELFGKFSEINNNKYIGLNIFDYYAKENPKRIVGESIMTFKNLKPIIGFQNRNCLIFNNEHPLFKVKKGYANNAESKFEGYQEYKFYGTYLIGPLLIRNPHLTEYIVKDILKKKYKKIKKGLEYQAYDEYIKNFYEKS